MHRSGSASLRNFFALAISVHVRVAISIRASVRDSSSKISGSSSTTSAVGFLVESIAMAQTSVGRILAILGEQYRNVLQVLSNPFRLRL
jgi:hypothetical protein